MAREDYKQKKKRSKRPCFRRNSYDKERRNYNSKWVQMFWRQPSFWDGKTSKSEITKSAHVWHMSQDIEKGVFLNTNELSFLSWIVPVHISSYFVTVFCVFSLVNFIMWIFIFGFSYTVGIYFKAFSPFCDSLWTVCSFSLVLDYVFISNLWFITDKDFIIWSSLTLVHNSFIVRTF